MNRKNFYLWSLFILFVINLGTATVDFALRSNGVGLTLDMQSTNIEFIDIIFIFLISWLFTGIYWIPLLIIGLVFKRVLIILTSPLLLLGYYILGYTADRVTEETGLISQLFRRSCYNQADPPYFDIQSARECIQNVNNASFVIFIVVSILIVAYFDKIVPLQKIQNYFHQKNNLLINHKNIMRRRPYTKPDTILSSNKRI